MIRRLATMIVFISTVLLAAFGQHIFGREDIIRAADRMRQDGPHYVEVAWNRTDKALAALVPEAGTEVLSVCSFSSLEWANKIVKS